MKSLDQTKKITLSVVNILQDCRSEVCRITLLQLKIITAIFYIHCNKVYFRKSKLTLEQDCGVGLINM